MRARFFNLQQQQVLAMLICLLIWMQLGARISFPPSKAGAGAAAAASAGNPANDLVALVNEKRAATRLPSLRASAGLGCMALQYISDCVGMGSACSDDNGKLMACSPPESHITEVYAANCGVELPTVDVISGRLIGCSGDPLQDIAAAINSSSSSSRNTSTVGVIHGKEHTQVGAAMDRSLWCLLFSSSATPNSTFLLEAAGKGIRQTHGCFSDATSCTSSASAPNLLPAAAQLLTFFLFFILISYC